MLGEVQQEHCSERRGLNREQKNINEAAAFDRVENIFLMKGICHLPVSTL